MRAVNKLSALLVGLLCSSALAAAEPLPQRWVSAGGALSEWIMQLGGADKLVGVDSTSQHLPALQALPIVGYQRQLAAEGILALRPDLLLGSEEMGPPTVLTQLRNAGVQVEVLSAAPEMDVLASNLLRIGELLGKPQQARLAASEFRQRLLQQQGWIVKAQQQQEAPGVLLLLGHAGSSPLVAGQDTAGAWLIEQAGGRNLVSHQGYKTISVEALTDLNPQVVLIADRSLQGDAARQALLQQNPALASTQAAKTGRLLTIDPSLLVGGLGPRLPDQLAVLAAAFYPAQPSLAVKVLSTP